MHVKRKLLLVERQGKAVGVNRTLLQRLLGGWAFALAFRREVFASLGVSHTAATTLPASRRCRVNGALLDELVLVTGLAPLLQTNLQTEPCEKLYATDASPSGVGGCVASITREAWLALHELVLALELSWVTLFSYRFCRTQAHRSLGTREPEPDQSPLACDIALDLLWVPTWANPSVASSRSKSLENWCASLLKLRPPPTAVFASAHDLSELNLLVNHCTGIKNEWRNEEANGAVDYALRSCWPRKRTVVSR